MTSWIFLSLIGSLLLLAGCACGFLVSNRRAAKAKNCRTAAENTPSLSLLPPGQDGAECCQRERSQLNDQLKMLQELCDELLTDREQSLQERAELEAQIQLHRELVFELETLYLNEHQARLASVEQISPTRESQHTLRSGVHSRALLIELGRELNDQQNRLPELRQELAECRDQLQQQQQQNALLSSSITELQDTVAASHVQIEEARAEERSRADRLAKQLQDTENSLLDMTTCAENLSTRLNLTQAELVEVTHQLAENHVSREADHLEPAERQENTGVHSPEQLGLDPAEIKQRLHMLLQQRDSALDRVNHMRKEIEALKSQATVSEETIGDLRRERDALRKREATATLKFPRLLETPAAGRTTPPTAAGPELNPVHYGGTTEIDPVLGLLYTTRPDLTDDLQQISGIAEVLETKLNKLGVYTYEQIFSWDGQAIAEFSKLLRFKDRMTRDNWQAQARQHYHEKYVARAA
ncbi:MAG: hypothetical protein MK108_00005 [Mariniblastus sp.]|nr:hypothetical protein [Mariniblastus sp.]